MDQDSYRLWIPIENDEHGLIKSVDVDENGDYIVQGVMTTDDKDQQNDQISPNGMDCSYFLSQGWIKYEHGNRPEQFIGEPLEIRVGQFPHPKLQKSVNGIFVKARLYSHRKLAKEAVATIEDLQKSQSNRCMGWSIEGQVQERDRKSGKILKSILRNVVLTMHPINSETWAELSKSFATNHEITVDCETPSEVDFDKSMDIDSIAEITPQSLEKVDTKEEIQKKKKYLKLMLDMVRKYFLEKSLRDQFQSHSPNRIREDTFDYALCKGFNVREAETFSNYIAAKSNILKSIFSYSGGGKMTNVTNDLDKALEEMEKSLNQIHNDESLVKAVDSKKDDNPNNESTEEENSTEEEKEDEKNVKKSFQSDLTKSLSEKHNSSLQESAFLTDLTNELGVGMSGLEKSMMQVIKTNDVLTKGIKSIYQANQELSKKIESLEADNQELKKSLDDILQRPVGRKSVVSAQDRQTLSKSASKNLSLPEVKDILMKSFDKGDLKGTEIIRFENGVRLENLDLPISVRDQLGI